MTSELFARDRTFWHLLGRAVMVGFLTGLAVLIILGQLGDITGLLIARRVKRNSRSMTRCIN